MKTKKPIKSKQTEQKNPIKLKRTKQQKQKRKICIAQSNKYVQRWVGSQRLRQTPLIVGKHIVVVSPLIIHRNSRSRKNIEDLKQQRAKLLKKA